MSESPSPTPMANPSQAPSTVPDLLPGEIVNNEGIFEEIAFSALSLSGTLYVTNYRLLFIPTIQNRPKPQKISVPLLALLSIEKIGGQRTSRNPSSYYLKVNLKDTRILNIYTGSHNHVRSKLFSSIDNSLRIIPDQPFCFSYHQAIYLAKQTTPTDQDEIDWFQCLFSVEYPLMGVLPPESHDIESDAHAWRLTNINNDFSLSKTYPPFLCVPCSVSDEDLKEIAKFRGNGRIPVLSYAHISGKTVCRSAQPKAGLTSKRNDKDENLLKAISQSHADHAWQQLLDVLHQSNHPSDESESESHQQVVEHHEEEAPKNETECVPQPVHKPVNLLPNPYTINKIRMSLNLSRRKSLPVPPRSVSFSTNERRHSMLPSVAESDETKEPSSSISVSTPAPSTVATPHTTSLENQREEQYVEGETSHPSERSVDSPPPSSTVPLSEQGEEDKDEQTAEHEELKTQSVTPQPENEDVKTESEDQTTSLQERASPSEKSSRNVFLDHGKPMLIIDARPFAAAFGNAIVNGGWEKGKNHPFASCSFLNIDNIHEMRKSMRGLTTACRNLFRDDSKPENFAEEVRASKWSYHVNLILTSARSLVEALSAHHILIHCTDGWDRTPALTSLISILSNPYFRTIHGFLTLIDREWCLFGHRFGSRTGFKRNAKGVVDPNQISPTFVQFLDCVFQILMVCPTEFEFTERTLRFIARHTTSGLFGNFLSDTYKEMADKAYPKKTESIFNHIRQNLPRFTNPTFIPSQFTLHPSLDSFYVWPLYFPHHWKLLVPTFLAPPLIPDQVARLIPPYALERMRENQPHS
ncbi:putative Phosphoinositide 3-phosphatase [Blattamonas nauphoetae]|uniref:Phosphoinositide 3-phosphatase n=1 Tax=Blattamonas nauphoetae TaxID=2049346 RepID=A0ABQ9YC07_9EUKA|nr:putative Phosphoinositide 3-phosphatase [Blattamonas nauphoetae]